MTSIFRRGFGLAVAVTCAAFALLVGTPALADIPVVKLVSGGSMVSPTTAWSYYGSGTTHTNGSAYSSATAPEIKAMARTLGAGRLSNDAYAQNVLDYVSRNITIEFHWGLSKGARAALLDKSGTAFDAAELMVKLLREGGVTASYQVGTITINGDDFARWTGLKSGGDATNGYTVSAKGACQFLADGGFPGTINGSGACSSLTGTADTIVMGHIWVSANGKYYDPAFNRRYLSSGIDIAAAVSCGTTSSPTCGSTVTTAALSGATTGTLGSASAPYVQDLNESGVNSQLSTYATNLQHSIETNEPGADVIGIVGGAGGIEAGGGATSSAPHGGSAQYTWSGDIPDQFRTTLRIQYQEIDQTLYADEIAPTRVRIYLDHTASGSNFTRKLYADAILIASASCSTCTTTTTPEAQITLTTNHPYAASSGAYGDDAVTMNASNAYGPITVIQSWGRTSKASVKFAVQQQKTNPSPFKGGASGYTGSGSNFDWSSCTDPAGATPTCRRDDQPTLATLYLAQKSQADVIIGGIDGGVITPQHTLGVVFTVTQNSGLPIASLNTQTQVGIALADGGTTNRSAAFETAAITYSVLEGSVGQQNNGGAVPVSAVANLVAANRSHIKLVSITAANMSATLPSLTNYSTRTTGLSAAASAGYNFILPQDGQTSSYSSTLVTGGADIAYQSDRVGYLVMEDRKAATGGLGLDPAGAVVKTATFQIAGRNRISGGSVDLAEGDLSVSPTADLIVGNGQGALSFQRFYNSGHEAMEQTGDLVGSNPVGWNYFAPDQDDGAHIGGGWTHNWQIGARLGANALRGLGSDNGLDASAAIAALFTLNDAAKSPSFNGRLASVLIANWLGNQFVDNAVVVRFAPHEQVFARLPDGRFNSGYGSPNRLTQSGSRSGPSTDYQGQTHYDYSGVSFTFTDSAGGTVAFDNASSTGWYGGTSTVTVGDPVFKATTITQPNGFRITLAYSTYSATGSAGAANYVHSYLTSVSNVFGRSLTFTSSATGILNQSGVSLEVGRRITQVTDETGRHVDLALSNCPSFYVNNGAGTASSYSNWTAAALACNTLTVTAPDGAVTKYDYAAGTDSPDPSISVRPAYRLRRWYAPSNSSTAFGVVAYDELFRAKTTTDILGHATTYYAGGVGGDAYNPGQAADPLGNVSSAWLDAYGNPSKISDALGRNTTYGVNYLMISGVTYPEYDGSTSTSDVRGNVLSVTRLAKPASGSSSTTTTTVYGEGSSIITCSNPKTCNLPTSSTDARFQTTNYTYDGATGNLTQVLGPADVNGARPQTDYGYTTYTIGGVSVSLLTSKTEKISSTQSVRTSYDYDVADPANKYELSTITVDDGSSPHLNLVTTLTYNSVGDVTGVDGPRNDVTDVTNYTYDAARRPLMTIMADPDGGGSLPRPARRITYTKVVSGVTIPAAADGLPLTVEFGTTTSSTGLDFSAQFSKSYAYDTADRQIKITAATGVTQTTYDNVDRTICVARRMNPSAYGSLPSDACTLGTTGSDGADRIVKYTYDAAGQVTVQAVAYGATPQANYATYTYSPNGKVLTIKDADSNRTTYTYDGLDRLATISPPITTQGADSSGSTYLAYTYDSNDNVTSVTRSDGFTVTLTYDNLNRVVQKDLSGSPAIDTYYSYDLLGQMLYAHLGSAGGSGVDYTYDLVGRLTSETAGGRTMSYQYDAAGNRARETWPDSFYAGYGYDALNRVTTVSENGATSGVGVLATYSYDSLGRRSGISRGNGTSTSYSYDSSTGNLSSLGQDFSGTTNDVTFGFTTYNSAAGITTRTVSNSAYVYRPTGINRTYITNGLNQYSAVSGTTNSTYNYTADGSVASESSTGHSFTYDREGRLMTASAPTALTLSYDTVGRLQSTTASSTTTNFLYAGNDLSAEYDASGTVLRRYVHGPGMDEPLVWYEGSGTSTRRWLHADELGSIVAYSDTSGVNGAIYAYGPDGEPNSWSGSRFRYTGQIMLPEAQLYHYKARVYDPAMGRFLQRDPLGFAANTNFYSYVSNDPVNFIDPTGMIMQCSSAPNVDGGADGCEVSEVVVTASKSTPKNPIPDPVEVPVLGDDTFRDQMQRTEGHQDNPKGDGSIYPPPKKKHSACHLDPYANPKLPPGYQPITLPDGRTNVYMRAPNGATVNTPGYERYLQGARDHWWGINGWGVAWDLGGIALSSSGASGISKATSAATAVSGEAGASRTAIAVNAAGAGATGKQVVDDAQKPLPKPPSLPDCDSAVGKY